MAPSAVSCSLWPASSSDRKHTEQYDICQKKRILQLHFLLTSFYGMLYYVKECDNTAHPEVCETQERR